MNRRGPGFHVPAAVRVARAEQERLFHERAAVLQLTYEGRVAELRNQEDDARLALERQRGNELLLLMS